MYLILTEIEELTVHHFALIIIVFHLQKIDNGRVVNAVLHLKSLVFARYMPALAFCGLPFNHLGRHGRRLEIGHLRCFVEVCGIIKGTFLQHEDSADRIFMQFVFLLIFGFFGVTSHEHTG